MVAHGDAARTLRCDWLPPSCSVRGMRGEFPASPTLSELTLSALTGLCCVPACALSHGHVSPLPFVTSAALTGNMKANYLLFTKWLCALWSVGTCYHLHHRDPGHRHHGVKLSGPDAVIDFLATMLMQKPQLSELAQQVNTTPSQAPPPPAPNPPAEEGPSGRSDVPGDPKATKRPANDALLLGVVVACAVAGLVALTVAGVCWCRMRKEMKMAERTDYPAYKQSPPPPYEKSSPGDKKLAQNAQMYHYQHQKQQMISMEKNKDDLKHPDSAVTSDEENEDGDFTVYECPGLAPTGEMEVKNPLFDDSSLHHPSHGHH